MSENRDFGERLLAQAFGFYLVAKRIAEADWPTPPWPLFFTNLGYAFELSLKAYIVAAGGTEADCISISHNLQEAHDRACNLGLTSSDDIARVIGLIGPYHRDSSFRYLKHIPDNHLREFPDFPEALCVSDKLLQVVGGKF